MSRHDAPIPLPGSDAPAETPVFEVPWQAEVFAMAVTLSEAGLFTWAEWATALSAELTAPGEAADGSGYYAAWTRALEALLARKGVADADEIEATAAAWQRAAHATPHGRPIVLANDPERHGYRHGHHVSDAG